MGLSSSGRDHACIRVFDPTSGKVKFFRSNVLPFGSIRSVHSFLRLSRAIWWIGVVGYRLVWTSFYDDFIAYSRPKLAGNTDATVSTLFKLLGWAFAESGDKCVPFSSSCEALGVSFDLSASSKGYASICNTAGRVDELCADLDNVLREGTLSSKQAQRLRGRMQFADAQLFGRTGKRCLKSLSDFSEGRRVRLQPKDCLFLRLFSSLLKQNVPREVRAFDSYSTVFFTDACYERDSAAWPCGIGGVFFCQKEVQYFSVRVGASVRKVLGELHKSRSSSKPRP